MRIVRFELMLFLNITTDQRITINHTHYNLDDFWTVDI